MIKLKSIFICTMVAFSAIMFTSCKGHLTSNSFTLDSKHKAVETSEDNPYYDIIIPDADWVKLSLNEKTIKAQQIVELEKQNLGIADNILISMNCYSNTFELKQLNDNTYMIDFNPAYFDSKSSSEVIQIICQEIYKVYQHKLIQQYLKADDRSKHLVCYDKARLYLKELFKTTDEPTQKSACQHDMEKYYKERYEELYLRYLMHHKGDGLISDKQ